jgi:hypothetical protein
MRNAKEEEKQTALHLCIQCEDNHAIPSEGFPPILALKGTLNTHIEQLLNVCPEYEQPFLTCENLRIQLADYRDLRNDPMNYIYKKIAKLKRKVDVLKEKAKLRFDDSANEIVDTLIEYEQECKKNLD